jgi:putative flippase GtrA
MVSPIESIPPRHQHPSLFEKLSKQVPGGELLRYLCVGVFNTLFGYATFALALHLLNHALPQRYLYFTVVLASVVSTPLNITVAYFGYKFFVFRTRGRYLVEWLKCFAVYGTAMLPGLFALSALTRILQANLSHKSMAGYLAGGIVTTFTTLYSFLGHKNITFKRKPATT